MDKKRFEAQKIRHKTDDAVLRNQKKKPITPKEWRSIAVDAHSDRDELISTVEELRNELAACRSEQEIAYETIREAEARVAELEAVFSNSGDIDEYPPLVEARSRIAELEAKLNPLLWTREMDKAWHTNIPNLHKAFEALRNAPKD